MSLIAELVLRDPILFTPTFERVPEAECRFEDFHYLSDAAGEIHYVFFWWTSNCDFNDYEDAMERDPTIRTFHRVARLPRARLYRIVTKSFPSDQPLVFPFFREHDTTVLEAKRTRHGLELRARFPSRTELRAFLAMCEDIARGTELRQLIVESPEDGLASPLTHKQREALELAHRRGYFATPRRVSLTVLAEELDITPQSLSIRLRRGLNHVVGDAIEFDRAYSTTE